MHLILGDYCKGRDEQCCEAECVRVEGTYGPGGEWWTCDYQQKRKPTPPPGKDKLSTTVFDDNF